MVEELHVLLQYYTLVLNFLLPDQVILTAEVSGGSHGGRIFRSSDFAKNFVQTNLPFHPLTQMMYSPQNSDYLLALSTEVSLSEEPVLPFVFYSLKTHCLKRTVQVMLFMLDWLLVTSYGMKCWVFGVCVCVFSYTVKDTIFICCVYQIGMCLVIITIFF